MSWLFCYAAAMAQREYHFWVYILSSRSRNLYVGMTNALIARTRKHREHIAGTYTARYAIDRLVYFEYFQYIANAIAREKALKHSSRAQKIELIERGNPTWEDLFPGLVSQPMTWQEAQAAVKEVEEGPDEGRFEM